MTALSFVHLIMGLQALNSAALAGLVWWDYIAERRARPAPNPRRRLRGVGARLYRRDGWSAVPAAGDAHRRPPPVLKIGWDIHICAIETGPPQPGSEGRSESILLIQGDRHDCLKPDSAEEEPRTY